MHHARWMAKALHTLKIFMFKEQFIPEKSKRDINALREISLFIVIFYIKCWFDAPDPTKAPNQDLQLLKDLKDYEKINAKVAKAALNKLLLHLWYLTEKLAPLAFFDDSLPLEAKSKWYQL